MATLTWQEKRDNLVKSIDDGAGVSANSLKVLWMALQYIAGEYQVAKSITFLGLPVCTREAIRDWLVNLD